MMQPHCSVSKQTVSPLRSNDAAPLYGATSSDQELTVSTGEASGDAPAAPAEEGEREVEAEAVETAEKEEGEGEVRKPRVGKRPLLPTKAELEEHYPLHLNYRSWCPHCRAGKARLAPHLCEPSDREKIGITVHSDYAFLGPAEEEEGMQPCLVVYDDDKNAFWAIGIKSKAVTQSIVKYFKDLLDQSGYEGEKITMKSDQEPSILALKRAVAAARSGQTVPIESPVRSSKSNGKMEGAIGIWQGQIRTIKHFTEEKLKKRIEVDGVMYSWLVPFCADIMNKYKIGPDGRTAYEKITGHKCRQVAIGFAEIVDYILEPSKAHMHKADTRVMQGVFLGYEWRTTEYIIGTVDGIFKCRTVRRRAEQIAYDPECMNYINVSYDDYTLEGARTTPIVKFAPAGGEVGPVPTRGREHVPRRKYTKPADFMKHGYTEGCRGCTWLQNQLGPRTNHSEACHERIEKAVINDGGDERAKKVRERIDHYTAQVVEQGDDDRARVGDPREKEPNTAQSAPHDDEMKGPEKFQIGSPSKDNTGNIGDELDDGPTIVSEKRMRTPVRAPPTKRRSTVHNDEPGTKKIITGDLSDDDMEDLHMTDLGAIAARKEDEWIVCQAVLGKDLHEVFTNKRVQLAVDRQCAEYDMAQARVIAHPGVGDPSAGLPGKDGCSGLAGVDVVEVFSPERVGQACAKYGLQQGTAMDIKSGYDFDLAADRASCWAKIEKEQPTLVIGSPPCTLFSRLQELNKFMYRDSEVWMAKFQDRMQQAKRYVKFCTTIYEYQRSKGRYFLHEHPWLATSWSLECIAKLEALDDVRKVQTHMCQFGMKSRTEGQGSELGPVLKPTGFLTNSVHIARELHKTCPRDHKHVNLVGGRAAGAAIYPDGLCQAICRGLAAQKREDKTGGIRSLAMNPERLLSLSMACSEASGGYPPEIVNKKGEFDITRLQMEVNSVGGGNREVQDEARRRDLQADRRLAREPARRHS